MRQGLIDEVSTCFFVDTCSLYRSCSFESIGKTRRDLPGEQFVDTADGMGCDPGENRAEIEFRGEAVVLG